jgi:hypothetical protein
MAVKGRQVIIEVIKAKITPIHLRNEQLRGVSVRLSIKACLLELLRYFNLDQLTTIQECWLYNNSLYYRCAVHDSASWSFWCKALNKLLLNKSCFSI